MASVSEITIASQNRFADRCDHCGKGFWRLGSGQYLPRTDRLRDYGRRWRRHLPGRSRAPPSSARNSSASAAGSCIPSMPPRSSASARARPARLTSSASRLRSSPPTPDPRAASSCCTPRRCPATLDGHTLRAAIEGTERLTGREIERAYVDKGYRGHDASNPHRVFISGQKRGVFGAIKHELRRRSAIEPVIGHMKAEGHLSRCYLKGT